MSFYDSDSPATSESQTPITSPYFPSGDGGYAGGIGSTSGFSVGMASTMQPSAMGTGMQSQVPGMMQQAQMQMPGTMQQSQMPGMMQQPQMGGQMPGYYNMPYQMPGYYNMPQQMPQQMGGMQQMPPPMGGMQQMPQQMGGMQQMPPPMGGMQQMPPPMGGMQQMPPAMGGMQNMPPQMMPQMNPHQPATSPGMRHASPLGRGRRGLTPPAPDSVYRPYFDMLCSDSPIRTAQETNAALEQFSNREMFSFEDLGISPLKSQPRGEPSAPRSRAGKEKATPSQATGSEGPAEAGGGRRRRAVWTIPECIALAKAWISVVEDVYVANNQVIDRMWARIAENYAKFKPEGSVAHPGSTCRKQWDRLKKQLSRFAGLYQKNLQMSTSGMTSDDVRDLAHQQFPDIEKGFGDFKYWEVYLVVQESPKFMAGVESGWPKRTKINSSGEYSSSAGSHELPPAESDLPARPTSARRRRPVGQKSALRRGSGSRSQDVESAPASSQMPDDLAKYADMQMAQLLIETVDKWEASTNPAYKNALLPGINTLRRNLGYPPFNPPEFAAADDDNDATDDGE